MAGKTEYKNNWQKENVDRVNLTMAKGRKETIKAHAEARGESVNGFINRAISETMERDVGGPQEAAEAAGEDLPQFVTRAIESRAKLDKRKKHQRR